MDRYLENNPAKFGHDPLITVEADPIYVREIACLFSIGEN